MERFLLIRTSSLGDIVHALPAFAALRRRFPEAEIRWVVGRKGKDVLDWVAGIDAVVVTEEPGWLKKIRGRDQTVLDFQGLLKSGLIAFETHARRRIGFHPKNLREPLSRLFYTERAARFPETEHVILKNLNLLKVLGIEGDALDFAFAVPEEARRAAREKGRDFGWTGEHPLVLFNVGAGWATKRWFPERWSQVLKGLAALPIHPVLLWGSESERRLAEEVSAAAGVPLVPYLSLKESVALISQAALLVSGDTFALQIACALRVPVVGIFGPTDPRRNGPFLAGDRVAFHEAKCSRCYKRACAKLDCLKSVTAEEIVDLIGQALPEYA